MRIFKYLKTCCALMVAFMLVMAFQLNAAESTTSASTNKTTTTADKATTTKSKAEELHEITKKLNDPVSDIMFFIIKDSINQRVIRGERYSNNDITFQPVIPFSINDKWKIMARLTVDYSKSAEYGYNSIPGKNAHDKEDGMYDPDVLLGLAYVTDNGFIMSLGLNVSFPWATLSYMKSNDWKLGPAAVVFYRKNNFSGGVIFSQFTSTNDDYDNNLSSFQYIVNYTIGAWNLHTSPTITYDYKNHDLDFPIGVGISKTMFLFGKLPLNLGVEYDYSVVTPNYAGHESSIIFSVIPIAPTGHKYFKTQQN